MAVKRFEYGPIFNQSDSGANRYVTSGELPAGAGTGDVVAAASNRFTGPEDSFSSNTIVTLSGLTRIGGNMVATDVQISGTTLAYKPIFQGSAISANRYVTSGEIAAGGGAGTVTSVKVGSNLVVAPAAGITTTGTVSLSPTLLIATLGTTGDVLVSGMLLGFQPFYQGSQVSAQRYVTSGELSAAGAGGTVTSLKAGTNVILAPTTITTTGTVAVTPTPTFSSVWVTGDVLTSGTQLTFGTAYQGSVSAATRYVTSGELKPPGTGTVTSLSPGANITLAPNPITTTGTVGLTPNISIDSLVVTGNTLASGTLLSFAPVFQGAATSAQRYVTSGEMRGGTVTSIVPGSNVVLQANPLVGSGSIAVVPNPVFVSVSSGDVLVSGQLLVIGQAYETTATSSHRFVTSGELRAPGTGTVTSLKAGSNIVLDPTTITTTGTIALSPNPVIDSLLVLGNTQVSGTILHYGPLTGNPNVLISGTPINAIGTLYQGFGTLSAQRYITSGELASAASVSGITTLNALTAQSQAFATGTTGSDFNISSLTATHTFNIPDAGLFARGALTTTAQSISGTKTFVAGIVDTSTLLVSGQTLLFSPAYQGLVTGGSRYVTSGELLAPGVTTSGTVTSLKSGSNIVLDPTTITTTGTIALSPNITVISLVDTGTLLVSGQSLLFAPAYQGVVSTGSRYVTSGELIAAGTGTVTSLKAGSNIVLDPATITTTGTVALNPNISIASIVDTGTLLVSGQSLLFAPAFQATTAGGNRYVTSGELRVDTGITTLNTLTATTQTFATDGAGNDFAISSATSTHTFSLPSASAFARGVVTTTTQTLSGIKTWADNQVNLATTQLSGTTFAYAPIFQGAQTAAQRYVTSGELRADAGGTVTSLGAGDNISLAPTTITTTGTIALSPNITVTSIVDTGAFLVSGTTLHFAPAYQGVVSTGSRYVTSGELSAAGAGTVTSLKSGSNIVLDPSTITTTGTIALSPNPVITSLVVTGNTQISGTTLYYGAIAGAPNIVISGTPINFIGTLYQGFQTLSAQRYVTSGELGAGGSGITSLNGLVAAAQTLAVGTAGNDFAISSDTSTHTFNLPSASAFARGVVTTTSQTLSGVKTWADDQVNLGATQLSGTTLAHGLMFQGSQVAAQRYVTSGEFVSIARMLSVDGTVYAREGNISPEIQVLSYTVPANLLGPNGGLVLTMHGKYRGNTAGNNTFNVFWRFGGKTLISGKAMNAVAGTATERGLFIDMRMHNAGVTGSQRCSMRTTVGTSVSASGVTFGINAQDTLVVNPYVGVDTTQSQIMTVGVGLEPATLSVLTSGYITLVTLQLV